MALVLGSQIKAIYSFLCLHCCPHHVIAFSLFSSLTMFLHLVLELENPPWSASLHAACHGSSTHLSAYSFAHIFQISTLEDVMLVFYNYYCATITNVSSWSCIPLISLLLSWRIVQLPLEDCEQCPLCKVLLMWCSSSDRNRSSLISALGS